MSPPVFKGKGGTVRNETKKVTTTRKQQERKAGNEGDELRIPRLSPSIHAAQPPKHLDVEPPGPSKKARRLTESFSGE